MMLFELPCNAEDLVPHRPPMRLVSMVMARDMANDTGTVSATVPDSGIWLCDDKIMAEYLMELMAQAMAAINGYDCMCRGEDVMQGFLVGVDGFSWNMLPDAGAELTIFLEKKFKMHPVTIMSGKVLCGDMQAACGEIKVWSI